MVWNTDSAPPYLWCFKYVIFQHPQQEAHLFEYAMQLTLHSWHEKIRHTLNRPGFNSRTEVLRSVSQDNAQHCQVKIMAEMQRHQCHSTDMTQTQFVWTQASYCCMVAGGFNPKHFTRILSSWHDTVQILLYIPCKPTSNRNISNSPPLTAASVSHLLALEPAN